MKGHASLCLLQRADLRSMSGCLYQVYMPMTRKEKQGKPKLLTTQDREAHSSPGSSHWPEDICRAQVLTGAGVGPRALHLPSRRPSDFPRFLEPPLQGLAVLLGPADPPGRLAATLWEVCPLSPRPPGKLLPAALQIIWG